jgi:hypothetical protein
MSYIEFSAVALEAAVPTNFPEVATDIILSLSFRARPRMHEATLVSFPERVCLPAMVNKKSP